MIRKLSLSAIVLASAFLAFFTPSAHAESLNSTIATHSEATFSEYEFDDFDWDLEQPCSIANWSPDCIDFEIDPCALDPLDPACICMYAICLPDYFDDEDVANPIWIPEQPCSDLTSWSSDCYFEYCQENPFDPVCFCMYAMCQPEPVIHRTFPSDYEELLYPTTDQEVELDKQADGQNSGWGTVEVAPDSIMNP